jgi:hypothetical protein
MSNRIHSHAGAVGTGICLTCCVLANPALLAAQRGGERRGARQSVTIRVRGGPSPHTALASGQRLNRLVGLTAREPRLCSTLVSVLWSFARHITPARVLSYRASLSCRRCWLSGQFRTFEADRVAAWAGVFRSKRCAGRALLARLRPVHAAPCREALVSCGNSLGFQLAVVFGWLCAVLLVLVMPSITSPRGGEKFFPCNCLSALVPQDPVQHLDFARTDVNCAGRWMGIGQSSGAWPARRQALADDPCSEKSAFLR